MKRSDTIKMLAMLQNTWPDYSWSDRSPEVYEIGLEGVSYARILIAVAEAIRTSTFCPKPAELRKLAVADLIDAIPTASEAWEEVVQQIYECGVDRVYHFSHPLIMRAVKAIGWRQLVLSERPGMERRDFMALYTDFRDKAARATLLDPHGQIAAGNGHKALT